MLKESLKEKKKEDIDIIISSLFAPAKQEKETDSDDIISNINTLNAIPAKVLPITMRKFAAYQNKIVQKQKEIKEEVLPISLRKRLLYERAINN